MNKIHPVNPVILSSYSFSSPQRGTRGARTQGWLRASGTLLGAEQFLESPCLREQSGDWFRERRRPRLLFGAPSHRTRARSMSPGDPEIRAPHVGREGASHSARGGRGPLLQMNYSSSDDYFGNAPV